ncbi:ribokinase [Clostridium sp. AF19-22AC]|jgi:ribokinase|uniref:PfkB family carbohydrate kinase n=1 Tax=Clostridia TaxID=186801 RepID=UPI000E53778C|nr:MULTISPECIES: PfkB family carbohydrate kinase [Clostridia]RHR20468.1 ribokinase [Clostridium sp. AF19-22AC]
MRPKILTAGSINMDLMMYNVEKIPRLGESAYCRDYEYASGGKASNQALALARMGAVSFLAGRVGNDRNGRQLVEQLEKAGVDTRYVIVDADHSTGLSTMNVNKRGEYFSVLAPGANNYIRTEDIKKALSENRFDMVVLQLEMPLETVYQTYEIAKAQGIPVFLDAGPAMSIPLKRFSGIFAISPNEAETEALTGIAPDSEKHIQEAAEWLYQAVAPEYVILKLGRRGALLYDGSHMSLIEAYPVEAVDSTAAGDTFGAAFAVQYCQGAKMDDAVRFANAAAAVCVTRKGGYPSIPCRDEAEEFYGRVRCQDRECITK